MEESGRGVRPTASLGAWLLSPFFVSCAVPSLLHPLHAGQFILANRWIETVKKQGLVSIQIGLGGLRLSSSFEFNGLDSTQIGWRRNMAIHDNRPHRRCDRLRNG